MSNIYDEILRRMIRYRTSLSLTQEQVSAIIGKTQSQYSKIELGKTILSFADLQNMRLEGWDIDYLITAKEGVRWTSVEAEALNKIGADKWQSLKPVIIWALGRVLARKDAFADRDVACEYELIQIVSLQGVTGSLLFELRNMAGMAQTVMAEKLGVNIKKYRDLERRITYPDAELLALIYGITSCKPSLFVHEEDLEEYLLMLLWNRITTSEQKEILAFIEHAACLYK